MTKKRYEEKGFEFEFTPDRSSPYRGLLLVRSTELEATYAAEISLSKPRSCNEYAARAAEICGMNVETMKLALNALCSRRYEEVAEEAELEEPDAKDEPEVGEGEIEERIGRPGVLEQFVEAAAACSNVVKERETLKLLTLVAVSAQLDLLPNGKPVGASCMLTGEPGRGKNHLCDAIARMLPTNFYFSFESSSSKALHYRAQADPTFLKHTWAYPNEAEGTDLLVETLRPLLSSGRAKHLTVNKDVSGANAGQQFEIEGPVTITIPTVRNVIDRQLQTRLLVVGLEDYDGRVADHSRAISGLLSPGYAATDHGPEIRAWQASLVRLTEVRRVVIPVHNERFCFGSDVVSYGARLWGNIMGLTCAHAWLEQRNREIVDVPGGGRAVVAAPEDYEAAYGAFEATCERSVTSFSGVHKKILDAMYALQDGLKARGEWDHHGGLTQRKIAQKAGVSQSTVSANRTYLVKSVKVVRETEGGGLALVKDAEPIWWREANASEGLPRPKQAREWWGDKPLASEPETADQADTGYETTFRPGGEANTGDRGRVDYEGKADDRDDGDSTDHSDDRGDNAGYPEHADRANAPYAADIPTAGEVIDEIDASDGDKGSTRVGPSDWYWFRKHPEAGLKERGWVRKDAVGGGTGPEEIPYGESVVDYIRQQLGRGGPPLVNTAAELFERLAAHHGRHFSLEKQGYPTTPEQMREVLARVGLALDGMHPKLFWDKDSVVDRLRIHAEYWEKLDHSKEGIWAFFVNEKGISEETAQRAVWSKVIKIEDLRPEIDWG